MHPTRENRKNYPIKAFKKDFWQKEYVEDGEDYAAYGDVSYTNPFPDTAKLDLYGIDVPKRMSSYSRYRKFIISPFLPDIIRELAQQNIFIPKRYRLQFLASASARLWEDNMNRLFYQRLGATTKEAQAKVKKNYKENIDNWVTAFIQEIHQNQQERNNVKDSIKDALAHVVEEFAHVNPQIDLHQLYNLDLANERLRQQARAQLPVQRT